MKYLFTLILVFAACGGSPRQQPPQPTTVTTSSGILVTSIQTLSLGHLAEIDRQCEDLHRIAEAQPNNYDVFPFCGKGIHIFIVARDMACGQIAFSIVQSVPRGTQYDGSEFDMDGQMDGSVKLCAAGRYHPDNDMIEVTADGIIQTEVVRYELEHWLLKRIDRDRYTRTLIHGNGVGHPILGDGLLQKALASRARTVVQ